VGCYRAAGYDKTIEHTIAESCLTVHASSGQCLAWNHFHSIINKSRKASIGAGSPVALSVEAMQNTLV